MSSKERLPVQKPTPEEAEQDPGVWRVADHKSPQQDDQVQEKADSEHRIRIRLDVLLVERRMTLTELSEKVGLHINALSRLKNGDISFIRLATLDKLCDVLECQPGDLIVRQGK